eukprot:3731179-Karenia_brevis.AAC.1
MGDVLSFREEELHTVFKRLPSVRFLLIVAGSPCQDLSGLNATRQGLAGSRSRLFFEVIRVWQMAKKCYP